MTLTPNGPLKVPLRVEDRGAPLAVSVTEALNLHCSQRISALLPKSTSWMSF